MTINSYTHPTPPPTHWDTDTSLYILFQNRIKEKRKKEKKKNCSRKQASIKISHIIYNPYVRGIAINSYTHTHTLIHTYIYTYYSEIEWKKKIWNRKVLQSVIPFTIHILQAWLLTAIKTFFGGGYFFLVL